MSAIERSTRTRVLFWLYTAVLTVTVALMLWLLVVLASYWVADEAFSAPPLVRWMTFALGPLIALRLALAWSMKRDQR